MEGMLDGLKYFGYAFVILLVICLISGIIFIYSWFTPTTIKSDHRIQPKIELIIKDNKVDSLFIYQK